jgi:hypothetical protein
MECPVDVSSHMLFKVSNQLMAGSFNPGPFRFGIAEQTGFFTA